VLAVDAEAWANALRADGEFRRASRGWTASVGFSDSQSYISFGVVSGKLVYAACDRGPLAADITFTGPPEGWRQVLSDTPAPYYQDLIGGAVGRHGFAMRGDVLLLAPYYQAIQRAVTLAAAVMRGER
jgi:hypothetical protein